MSQKVLQENYKNYYGGDNGRSKLVYVNKIKALNTFNEERYDDTTSGLIEFAIEVVLETEIELGLVSQLVSMNSRFHS